jgi:hypothetical protein
MTATSRFAAAASIAVVLALPGCAASEDARPTGQVLQAGDATDGLTVMLASEPDPLAAGDNSLEVTVRRPDGSPVTDATVTMVFSMPAMPSMNMPAMRSDAILRHDADGRYRGTSQLSMAGTWNVVVTVARGSDELAARRLSIVAKN